MTVDYANPVPSRSRRFTPQMLVLGALVLVLLGGPVYLFLRHAMTRGIETVGQYKKVDLKAMGFFRIDPRQGKIEDVPAEYRALDGQKVLLEGEMFNRFRSAGKVQEFELVYSIAKCCFGGPPLVQERVFALAPAGRGVELRGGFVRVFGTLRVGIERAGTGEIVSVYKLDVERIEAI